MKKIIVIGLLLAAVTLSSAAAFAQTGNGAPNGSHYNLNIIGVSKGKTADMTNTSGHTIFVPLWGSTRIWLCNSDDVTSPCYGQGFAVLDRNGTDSNGATFALPSPDSNNDGVTDYSVFARALGTPGGSSKTTTCTTGAGLDGILGTADDELLCSKITLTLKRDNGPSKFENVSKYLLYVYADTDGDGIADTRIPLFLDGFQDFYWQYDNQGLRLGQFRFYPCSSTVPSVTDPTGPTTDTCNP